MLAVMSFFMVGFVLIGIPMAFAIIAGMGLGLFFMGGLPHNLIIQRIATGIMVSRSAPPRGSVRAPSAARSARDRRPMRRPTNA